MNILIRICQIIIFILAVLTLASCQQRNSTSLPQEAAKAAAVANSEENLTHINDFYANQFQVIKTFQWPNGEQTIVFRVVYNYYNRPEEEILGYALVEQTGDGWHAREAGLFPTSGLTRGGQDYIRYTIASTPSQQHSDLIMGKILDSKAVQAIEVSFANGQIERDTGTDGFFALSSPQGGGACDIRVLDGQNRLLTHIRLLPSPCP